MKKHDNKIVEKPIDQLIPYARNARTHDDAQVAQIAGSIKEFGFTNPVLIDEHGGIVAGHGRVLAGRKLGLKTVPTLTLRGLSETQKRAYILADNKIALNAGWDNEMLRLEIEELTAEEIDLSVLGFSEADLNQINLDIQSGLNDPDEEWNKNGTVDYNEEEPCFRKIVVNFLTSEDVEAFKKTIGYTFSDKAKYIYYPDRPIKRQDVEYVEDESNDE